MERETEGRKEEAEEGKKRGLRGERDIHPEGMKEKAAQGKKIWFSGYI